MIQSSHRFGLAARSQIFLNPVWCAAKPKTGAHPAKQFDRSVDVIQAKNPKFGLFRIFANRSTPPGVVGKIEAHAEIEACASIYVTIETQVKAFK